MDLNKVYDRSNTHSIKWNYCKEIFGSSDVLPMWVADMDFPVAKEITDAIIKRASHPIYGYSEADDDYYASIVNWFKKVHRWDIKKDWIVFTPGVVPAIAILIQTFSKPNDKIIVQEPVYTAFLRVIKNNDREILNNPLTLKNGTYYMDFDDLEKKASEPDAKIMVLCSPHNPVGRVWTKDELKKVGDICFRNNVLLISDEIHSDLIYKGNVHTSFGSISDEFGKKSIVCTAPSKTFNLAGLQASNIIIPDKNLRDKFKDTLQRKSESGPNVFAIEAVKAAYTYGEKWLNDVIDYLNENINFLDEYLKKNIPQVKFTRPQGTYLVWLDFRALNLSKDELDEFMIKKAKVAFNKGYSFGEAGAGFERMNIACPRSILKEGLDRIKSAIDKLNS